MYTGISLKVIYTDGQQARGKMLSIFVITWINLEIIILNEANQTEKDKYHMISFICGI